MLGSLEKPDEADGMLIKLVMDAMEDFISENTDSDKINKRALDRVNKVLDKAKEMSESIGRNVTVAELAEETGMSEKTIRDAMRISGFKIDYIEG
jgi:RNA polymerase primary sigma factor